VIEPEGDGFLRVIKIRSTTSFGGEVKPSVPCRRFTALKRTFGHEEEPVVSVSKIQSGHFSPKSPDRLPDGSGSLIRIEQKLVLAVSRSLTTDYTYRPGNLRDEIPNEGGFGPPRAVTPWKKKKKMIKC
jgi:hypothetical protein